MMQQTVSFQAIDTCEYSTTSLSCIYNFIDVPNDLVASKLGNNCVMKTAAQVAGLS